jgi:predicted polyphosphate/ATP-dependent NAD kinase
MPSPVTVSLGLIVNPIAGMGGAVGLHGTDGQLRLDEARRRGAVPGTMDRTVRALSRLDTSTLQFFTVSGLMGADALAACGIPFEQMNIELSSPTTGADTQAAAAALAQAGCSLILFAGGDGTARDVVRGAGSGLPVLGIPSGVKMRSGVFAATPETAGDLANEFLASHWHMMKSADLLDVTEEGEPERLLGIATVPQAASGRLTGSKVSTILGSKAELDALCCAVAQELEADTLYLIGPGSTTGDVLAELGVPGTPLGVDGIMNGQLVGSDLSEAQIIDLMELHARVKLILGVVGGQGFLLGRGNQQLSPRVMRRLGPENLIIVSSALKLLSLNPAILWVDADGDSADWLAGYHRVRVAPRRSILMRVAAPT